MSQMVALSAAPVEYTIYTFDFPQEGQRRQSRWQRYAALADEDLALAQAQILSDTKKYHRIEVKKKYFDSRSGQAIDMTLKIYERGIERHRAEMIGFITGAALMIATAVIVSVLI